MKTLLCALIIALAASAAASTLPTPLQNADICNGWYKTWDDKIMAEMQDMPFVVGSQPTKDIILKARKLHTRILAYVTFYQSPPNELYQHANIHDHPDWVRIDSEGKDGQSVFKDEGNGGWLTTCANSFGYHEYVLKTVRLIMADGADGLFIDNAHPDAVCEGPKFGKHRHIYPDKDNIYAYRRLLEDIRAAVREYGPDKIVIANAGNPRDDWLGACDGQMLESYICSWAWNNRWSESKILNCQRAWGSWPDKGTAIVALSYVGHTKNPLRDDAFYCYAWARLSGFIWADWFTGKESAGDLYKVRLGPALGPMRKSAAGDYYSREFKWGLVVTTGDSKPASLRIPGAGHPRVLDLYNAERLKPGPTGDYEVTVPASQGRVYVY